jgi:hypothetical protein
MSEEPRKEILLSKDDFGAPENVIGDLEVEAQLELMSGNWGEEGTAFNNMSSAKMPPLEP